MKDGLYTREELLLAFVNGAKWWEWKKEGATMWQTDQIDAYEEAKTKYPERKGK
jgi:hypothetical protein